MPSVTVPGVGDITEVPPSVWESPFKTERPEDEPGSIQAPERAVCRQSVGKEEGVRDLSYLIILFLSPLFKTKHGKSPGSTSVRNTESLTESFVFYFSSLYPARSLNSHPRPHVVRSTCGASQGPPACLNL